ncbi:MAG: SDR family oxidoreductase [Pseudomonadales bacterium]|nr:SDR family oxidoreductase [Pseudomonadales bacterium]
MVRLDGKTALITGAASGIGRASAERMATEGAAIMCADIDGDGAEQTALTIEQRGGNASFLALDVSSESEVKGAVEKTVHELGGLDILFNNAGVGGGDFGWDGTIAINLSGVYYGLFYGVPVMVERGGGAVINTASIAGLVGLTLGSLSEDQPVEMAPGTGAYIAAKHGVAGLTKQFAVAFGAKGVRVNAIAPGYIETPMTEGIRDIDGATDYLRSLHPLGRLGQPEEIAAAAAFLASDEASFINGIVLPVDGGYTAR